MSSPESVGAPRYARWLPGPWIDRTDYEPEAEPERYLAECETCGERVEIAFETDQPGYEEAVRSAQLHWTDHVGKVDPDAVPYFVLPGAGRGKVKRTGRWADVVEATPYLLESGKPVPSRAVLNESLARGEVDAGMSGGCQWPSHHLSKAEYQTLVLDLSYRSPESR